MVNKITTNGTEITGEDSVQTTPRTLDDWVKGTFSDHNTRHENTGGDEVDITGLVGHQYGKNLLENQAFDSYDIDTSLPDFWALKSTPTLATIVDTLFPARKGNQITITATGLAQEGISIDGSATNWLKVLPLTTYTFSLDYKVTAGDTLRILINDYSGAAFQSLLISENVTETTATRGTFTFTTSVSADNLEIVLTAAVAGDIVFISHPKLEEGAIATPYISQLRDRKTIKTEASNAAPTPIIDSNRTTHIITALGAAPTFGAPTGDIRDGDVLIYRILDDSTPRAFTWNAIYRGIVAALPTTTVADKTMYVGFIYNDADTKWDMVALADEP